MKKVVIMQNLEIFVHLSIDDDASDHFLLLEPRSYHLHRSLPAQ